MSGHGARREAPSWNLRRFKGSEGTGRVAADRRKTFGRHPRRALCPHVGTARVGKTRGSSRLLANAGRGVLGVFNHPRMDRPTASARVANGASL